MNEPAKERMAQVDARPPRQAALYWLALGTFAIGTEGFMIAAILCARRITHQHLCAGVRAELTDLDRADGEGGSPEAAPGGDDDLFAGQRRCREHAHFLGPGRSTRAAGVRRRHVHAERERARRRPRTAGATWSRHRDCECGNHRCDCDRRSARGGRRQSPRVADDLRGRGRHVGRRRRGPARGSASSRRRRDGDRDAPRTRSRRAPAKGRADSSGNHGLGGRNLYRLLVHRFVSRRDRKSGTRSFCGAPRRASA